MTDALWHDYHAATTSPGPAENTRALLDLVARLDTPERSGEDDLRLLVHVQGSLALLAREPAQSAEHLAAAERAADAMAGGPGRDLAYFLVTEVAVRTGNPRVAVRCAPKVTSEGLASQGRQDLYQDTQDYLAQARANLRDPALSAALSAVQEELRIDPDLGVPFSQEELRDAQGSGAVGTE